ncbi:hypothetical protein M0812_04826 [Anaeramoeba flamelloides]|uniref:Uncharacterized protein n=1 Tax=Anaeramoeba flamelloides TaxID=1746091 RepID=A0AAV8AA31_9EUKA|nr:hypothetical protein M0812_04826 [Anaeramoeba flamelloides]
MDYNVILTKILTQETTTLLEKYQYLEKILRTMVNSKQLKERNIVSLLHFACSLRHSNSQQIVQKNEFLYHWTCDRILDLVSERYLDLYQNTFDTKFFNEIPKVRFQTWFQLRCQVFIRMKNYDQEKIQQIKILIDHLIKKEINSQCKWVIIKFALKDFSLIPQNDVQIINV